MRFKAAARLLSFAITLIIVFSSIPLGVFAVEAQASDNYNSAADGELLYALDFSSSDFAVGKGSMFVRGISKSAGIRNGTELKIAYANVAKNVTNQRIIGTLPAYSLANREYTLELDFSAHTSGDRAKIYFGYGRFTESNAEGEENLPLALEVDYGNVKPFRCMKDCTTLGNENSFHNMGEFLKDTKSSHFKIVLTGSAESEGYVTVDYAIYSTGTYGNDMIHKTGAFITPADSAFVTVGIGEWNAFTKESQFYSISNVALYKGDTSAPDYAFRKRYDSLSYGAGLLKLDTSGVRDESKNNVNGYSWVQKDSGVTVDIDGFMYCKPTENGTYGIRTTLPLEDEWNYGYYTMEFALNSDRRCAIGLLDIGEVSGVGFGFGANSEREMQEDGETPVVEDSLYFGQSFTQGGSMFNDDTDQAYGAITATGATLTVYNADAKRVITGGKVNVKIEFDCVKKVITLHEKCSDGWKKIAAIDYSNVSDATVINHIFSLHVEDAGAEVVIKNVNYTKGLSLTRLVRYSAGGVRSEVYYSADESQMNAVLDEYIEKYKLQNNGIYGFTANGTTTEVDLNALYSSFDDQFYGMLDLKLMPLINYEKLSEGAAMRGIRINPAENGKFRVNFVAAVGTAVGENIDEYDYIGFDVLKLYRATPSGDVSRESIALRSYTLCKKIKCDGVDISAKLFGGEYMSTATLSEQIAADGSQTDYQVTVFIMKKDGTKETYDSMTFTFVNGDYTPTAEALEIE